MGKKFFKEPNYIERKIVEDGEIYGTIRLKPSGVLWRANGKKNWRGLSLEKIIKEVELNGREKSK